MDEDELARFRAEIDQAKEGTKEFAGTLWTFFSALVDAGFDESPALVLTSQWMTTIMAGSSE